MVEHMCQVIVLLVCYAGICDDCCAVLVLKILFGWVHQLGLPAI